MAIDTGNALINAFTQLGGGIGQGLQDYQTTAQSLARDAIQQQLMHSQIAMHNQALAKDKIGMVQHDMQASIANGQNQSAAGQIGDLNTARASAGLSPLAPVVGGVSAGAKPDPSFIGPTDPSIPGAQGPTIPDWSNPVKDFTGDQTQKALLAASGYMPTPGSVQKIGSPRGGFDAFSIGHDITGTASATKIPGTHEGAAPIMGYGMMAVQDPVTGAWTTQNNNSPLVASRVDLNHARAEDLRAPDNTAPTSTFKGAGVRFAPSVESLIDAKAGKYGIDPSLVRAVIKNESGGNVKSLSPAGAQGLMQLMPSTAKDLGVTNPWDPEQNIEGGVKYLAQLSRQFNGDPRKVIAAYNAGPGALKVEPGGKMVWENPSYKGYAETRAYVPRVLADYNAYAAPADGPGKTPKLVQDPITGKWFTPEAGMQTGVRPTRVPKVDPFAAGAPGAATPDAFAQWQADYMRRNPGQKPPAGGK